MLNADSNYHQAISHLYSTHLQLEPIIISTLQQLSVDHPIRLLLEPHFDQTLAINELGRKSLLSELHSNLDDAVAIGLKGSLQLMEKFHQLAGINGRFSFLNQTFPAELQLRGLDKNKFPESFLYGRIGQRYWKALNKYVTACLARVEAYGEQNNNQIISLKRIQQDQQLFLWAKDIQTLGQIHSFPDLTSSQVLVEVITQILFLSTFQHSAMSSNLYDAHAFIPGRPTILIRPLPSSLDLNSLVDEAYIISAMPSYSEIQEVLMVSKLLGSSPNSRDVCAGLCNQQLLTNTLDPLQAVQSIQSCNYYSSIYLEFINDLRLIEKDFWFSNYLKPSRIAASVCI